MFFPHSAFRNPKFAFRNPDCGEVVEDYPEDVRGHSCLMLGYGEGDRAIHVVCSPKDEFLTVITAYLPDEAEWTGDFRVRIRS